ncbi:MAG: heme exporter protein CcmB [Luteibaculum sp.]
MSSVKAVYFLLQKEFKQELKDKSASWAILLYVLSSVYVAYLCFQQVLSLNTWVALLWVIVLFGTLNATTRVFDKEANGRTLLLNLLATPAQIVWSKSLFAVALSLCVSLVGGVSFFFLLGKPNPDLVLVNLLFFFLVLVLGSVGLGFLLVLINGIAFKSGSSLGLSTILALPVAMPLLLLLIRCSKLVLQGQPFEIFQKYFLSLGLLDGLIVMLSSLLFPYLWRD